MQHIKCRLNKKNCDPVILISAHSTTGLNKMLSELLRVDLSVTVRESDLICQWLSHAGLLCMLGCVLEEDRLHEHI